MWRSKKLVICVALALVLLFGSLGGVALAHESEDGRPGAGFLARLAEKLGIGVDELQAKMAEVREELPQTNGLCWPGKRGPAGLFEGLDEDTQADLKDELALAREEMKVKIADILDSYGIVVDALQAKFAENADGHRPFKRGFMGPRGMGGMRGFGFPCPLAE
ncbi:hypothetical protein ACFLVK_00700 [Chloroflexota bacterium]